jgi:lipoprotein-releasing system permease protein
VFQSGFYEYDANLALVSLPQARELYGIAGVSGLGLKTNHLDRADQIAAKVGQAAGSQYWARSWQAMNRNLFEALKLEKAVMMLILTMIILVACFTIISNLILMSIEKSRDIGILRALGATRASIRKIFLRAGMILGGIGVVLGTGLGLTIVQVLGKTQWIKLPQDVYYIDTLPFKIDWLDMAVVLVIAFAITAVSAIYPAARASKVNPVEAIRYG